MNTVRKIMVTVELSKEEAKRIKSLSDLTSKMLDDVSPRVSPDFKGELAEQKADHSMNDCANVELFESRGVRYIHVSQTFLEFFDTDEDGDFLSGSDYNPTVDFNTEQLNTIREFCGF